ncbi:hypothetical protein AN958_06228 [Leucoagaricus sp. SymC.cos]|nr:hypothetical protein AN958_06228 [Leucoagaricus sp. SymC.cos]
MSPIEALSYISLMPFYLLFLLFSLVPSLKDGGEYIVFYFPLLFKVTPEWEIVDVTFITSDSSDVRHSTSSVLDLALCDKISTTDPPAVVPLPPKDNKEGQQAPPLIIVFEVQEIVETVKAEDISPFVPIAIKEDEIQVVKRKVPFTIPTIVITSLVPVLSEFDEPPSSISAELKAEEADIGEIKPKPKFTRPKFTITPPELAEEEIVPKHTSRPGKFVRFWLPWSDNVFYAQRSVVWRFRSTFRRRFKLPKARASKFAPKIEDKVKKRLIHSIIRLRPFIAEGIKVLRFKSLFRSRVRSRKEADPVVSPMADAVATVIKEQKIVYTEEATSRVVPTAAAIPSSANGPTNAGEAFLSVNVIILPVPPPLIHISSTFRCIAQPAATDIPIAPQLFKPTSVPSITEQPPAVEVPRQYKVSSTRFSHFDPELEPKLDPMYSSTLNLNPLLVGCLPSQSECILKTPQFLVPTFQARLSLTGILDRVVSLLLFRLVLSSG